MDLPHLVRAHTASADKDCHGPCPFGKRFAPGWLAGKGWAKKGNLLPWVTAWMPPWLSPDADFQEVLGSLNRIR